MRSPDRSTSCGSNHSATGLSLRMFLLVCYSLLLFPLTIQQLLDQRQNLKFMVTEGLTPVQCWRRLEAVYGDETMSKPTVRRWHLRFQEGDGHTPVTDLACSGRPCVQTSPEKVEAAEAAVQDNCTKLPSSFQGCCPMSRRGPESSSALKTWTGSARMLICWTNLCVGTSHQFICMTRRAGTIPNSGCPKTACIQGRLSGKEPRGKQC